MDVTSQIQLIVNTVIGMFRDAAPKDTGNLAFNAIKQRRIDVNTWEIYVDPKVAPYMPYTNEEWISPVWHGKQNPNEKWWDNICIAVIEYIARVMGGEINNKE